MKPRDFNVLELRRALGGGENRYRITGQDLHQNDVILKGSFLYVRLREGLSLHMSDVLETRDFVSENLQEPGMSFVFFMKGSANVAFGDRPFRFGAPQGSGALPQAVVVNRARADGFTRRTRAGERVRKMSINVSSAWLEGDRTDGGADGVQLGQLLGEHLSTRTFAPAIDLRASIEALMSPAVTGKPLSRLFQECRSIEIVARMIEQVAGNETRRGVTTLSAVDQRRIGRAVDFIETNLLLPLTVETIASEAGISARSLQRLFRIAFECNVFDHVRRRRMEAAIHALSRDHVSVAQAAYIAGYGNAANFATAFRRLYGLTPTDVRRGRLP
jgi:AraC-like DNA-binding protein